MELSKQVLEANEQHKQALDQYTSTLQAELNAIDKLIADVETLPEEDIQGNPGDKWCLHAIGAFEPTSVIDLTKTLDPRSPFYEDATRREFYKKATTPAPFSLSERKYLEKAVIKENKRLTAIRARQSGQNAFEAVMGGNESFVENTEGIDWASVARDVSASNSPLGGRTAQECKVRWLGIQHPKINCGTWSDDEERRLHDLVESRRESGLDWVQIAELLGTNRSPVDCIRRYTANSRPTFYWSSAFDQKLLDAVQRHGNGNWSLVASEVSPDVSANQCQLRYGRSINPEIKRGKFSPAEDELLIKAIKAYGPDWVKVAQGVPGRTNAQCRNRYTFHMTGSIVTQAWGSEEDAELRAAVHKHGHQWEKVREELGCDRSRRQYASRYRVLTRWDAKNAYVGDTAASGPNKRSGGHLENEAAVAPDSMLDYEHANGDAGFHDDPPQVAQATTSKTYIFCLPNTLKGKRRGRKRKAPDSQPEPETGGSMNQGDHPNTSASTMRPKPRPRPRALFARVSQLDADTAANDISQIDSALEDLEQPGGSVNRGDNTNTSASTKPRPRASIARVSQLDVDTAAKDTSQIDPALEQLRTSPGKTADVSQGQSSAALTDFAMSDLSDLTDMEDVPPPKKPRTTLGPVKALAHRAPVRTLKPRARSSRPPPKPIPTFTMRTRSTAKNNIDIQGE